MDFTAQTVSILISADRTVQFPQGLSCVPGFLFSCAWRCSGSPTVMNIFDSLTNDECIVGSCKHYWLYIQTVFLVEVALTRTLEVKILNFQSTLQVFHQLVVHFSWTSFITFQISGGCWNPVLFWILFSNLRKHLQKRSAYSVSLYVSDVLYCFMHFPVVSFRAPLLCSTFNVLNSNGILWGLALEKYLYFKSS